MLTMTTWTALWGILAISLIGVITYTVSLLKYWKRKNIPYVSFEFSKRGMWSGFVIQKLYNWAKSSGHKHMGFFALWIPTYMPIDPAIIKNILGTDFNYFTDRGLYSNVQVDPIGAKNLFVLEGQNWKNLRNKVTPTFTSGKMKMMLNALIQIGDNLKNAVGEISSSGESIDIKAVLDCFTVDVIGSCAFGVDCNSFKNPNSEFTKIGHKLIEVGKKFFFNGYIGFSCPNISKFIGLRITAKDTADFFFNVTRETIKYREDNNVARNDLLQILINLKNDNKTDNDNDGLTGDEIAAQCFIFFLAGFEPSSSTMTFCLFELASNPEIQEKVRAEIHLILKQHNGEITYEALTELKYMEQVVDETLRKHPNLPVLSRSCVADYKIPGTDIVIDKRTLCIIPVYALHHDPDHFPNPGKFDPERFNNRSQIDPFTYLPFGNGPRNCVGLRFAKMQIKIGLIVLLKNFAFSVNEKTILPIQLNPNIFSSAILGDLWLNVSKLDN